MDTERTADVEWDDDFAEERGEEVVQLFTDVAQLDADVRAYEAWEADAELLVLFGAEDERLPPAAQDARRRERATHFALDRIKNRRWIDVQCTELLRRAEALGVPQPLPGGHLCFRIRTDGY